MNTEQDPGKPRAAPLPGVIVSEALRMATEVLTHAGIGNARSEAGWLLAEALSVTQAWLMTHPEIAIPPDRLGEFHNMVTRRATREPFAYVVGHREFFGLDLKVSPAVLIPRPETELLVESALRSLERLRREKGRRDLLAVDVGTGSGAIAIALAVREPEIRVIALDASTDALAVARDNAARHSVHDRVDICQSDLLDSVREPVDIVVANLPYVPAPLINGLEPEVSQHEPRTALDGGPDGTDVIGRLLVQASRHLFPPSALMLEIGEGQGQGLVELSRRLYPTAEIRVERDYAGLERLLAIEMKRGEIIPPA